MHQWNKMNILETSLGIDNLITVPYNDIFLNTIQCNVPTDKTSVMLANIITLLYDTKGTIWDPIF